MDTTITNDVIKAKLLNVAKAKGIDVTGLTDVELVRKVTGLLYGIDLINRSSNPNYFIPGGLIQGTFPTPSEVTEAITEWDEAVESGDTVKQAKLLKKYDLNNDSEVNTLDVDVAYDIEDTTEGFEEIDFEYIYDEATWNASTESGALKPYLENNPTEDRWNTIENRACNFNDKLYTVNIFETENSEESVEGTFSAFWYSDTIQKITNVDNEEEVYYLDMFYSLDDGLHELFEDSSKQTTTGKFARFDDMYFNPETCPQCWEGAINAPGAKYPWLAISFNEPTTAKIKLQYIDGEDISETTPWGTSTRKFNQYAIASLPTEFNHNEWIVPTSGETPTEMPAKEAFKALIDKK